MVRYILFILILVRATSCSEIGAFESSNFNEYEWKVSLDLAKDGSFRLSWKPMEHRVVFLVEAKTHGYLGLGFSLDGRMAKADIAVGWVHDKTKKAYLIDCHGDAGNTVPLRDVEQNMELLNGYQNSTHTVLVFHRLWDTCDRQDDVIIGNDTIKLIWALQDSDDPMDETLYSIRWHGNGNRGIRSVNLRNPQIKQLYKITKHLDIRLNNVTIPYNMSTIYWCKIFKSPRFTTKHHVVGYTPILEENNSDMIHHIILYECHGKPSFHMDQYSSESGFLCYTSKMPAETESCITPVVTWAIGSEGEFYPEHVGLPIGENFRHDKYYMLETHYDNPLLKPIVDNSGLRLYYTEKLRKHDGGIFVSGTIISSLHIIPPFQQAYKTAGYCDGYCTKTVFPSAGVNSISVVLHSHLASRKMKLRHFRQGEELPPIVQDDYYDFNYQQSRVLSREVTVFPGDELVTECTYNTMNRTELTQGGYSTKQEMCLAYITYYPKVPLAACQSMNPISFFFETLGIKKFYHYDMEIIEKIFLKLPVTEKELRKHSTRKTVPLKFSVSKPGNEYDEKENEAAVLALKQMADYTIDEPQETNLFQDLIILDPLEFRNKTFTQHLQNLPWKEVLITQQVEKMFYSGKHMTFCRLANDSLALPTNVHWFPNVTLYSVPIEENSLQCKANVKNKKAVNQSTRIITKHFLLFVLYLLNVYTVC